MPCTQRDGTVPATYSDVERKNGNSGVGGNPLMSLRDDMLMIPSAFMRSIVSLWGTTSRTRLEIAQPQPS